MEKQDYRIFKLTRILDLKILEEEFVPRSFPDKEELPPPYNRRQQTSSAMLSISAAFPVQTT